MLLRALETEHLRINIRWSALAPLSLNNLQTGYSSNPSETACCFPREFTRHWPPIFGMKLPPFSRLPARACFTNGARKSEQERQGGNAWAKDPVDWMEQRTARARDGAATISRTTRRIITHLTHPTIRERSRRFTYALAREYITHCIPPINRNAVNGDYCEAERLRASGNLYNDVGETTHRGCNGIVWLV